MSPPRVRLLATPWGTLGDLATACFVLAALSGVAVAIPFKPSEAYGSLATLLLTNAPGVFFRNLHYWSGQLCLVLTLLHLWDHLRLGTELGVRRGIWARLVLTVPVLLYLMLSGFLLRGDADAQQALRIVSEILDRVPVFGSLSVTFLFGREGRLDVVYMQHMATATLLVWLFIVEHTRRLWPKAPAFLAAGLAAGALSLGLSPGLHDGLDPVVKGPWYFLGLQEILHWTRWPAEILVGALIPLLFLHRLPRLRPPNASGVKRALLGLGLAYALLCVVGGLWRGEGWAWGFAWPQGAANLHAGWVFASGPAAPARLPVVQGRPEGCLVCHGEVTGLGDAHRPEALGCASCHGGDPLSLVKARAHAGLRRVPGNLEDAALSCGTAACHPGLLPRVERSVMSTMSGVVDVDRRVFGEAPLGAPPAFAHVKDLRQTPADTHLRQLCASCHLGQEKLEPGPDNGDTPGGGCTACHLDYSPAAAQALADYQRRLAKGPAEPPKVHPALSLAVDNGKCFLCHSRSGRISTSFEGWMELHDPPDSLRRTTDSREDPLHRTLADNRVFERIRPDIHHERGMDCIDCHGAKEVMGDGVAHARKSGQLRLGCADCHAAPGQSLPSLPLAALDAESRTLLKLRKVPVEGASRFLQTGRGEALVNGTFDASGRPVLLQKRTGRSLPLKPQSAACTGAPGHARLSCGACHTDWTPSCTTCHTAREPQGMAYDWLAGREVRGAWRERSSAFEARPPTLGIQALPGTPGEVRTFAPGMVLSIDHPGGAPAFQRLYARSEPHTTRREGRTCRSCHNDPEALGYGKGRLAFERTATGGRWTFAPAQPAGPDGLPADAWIPFLGTRPGPVSTRPDVRPFSVAEQKRILEVGACLTCHDDRSAPMRAALRDYPGALRRRSRGCRTAEWD